MASISSWHINESGKTQPATSDMARFLVNQGRRARRKRRMRRLKRRGWA